MKRIIMQIFLFLFNKFFSTKIDSETVRIFETAELSPEDVNILLTFRKDHPDDFQLLLKFHQQYKSLGSNGFDQSDDFRDGILSLYLNLVLDLIRKLPPKDISTVLDTQKDYLDDFQLLLQFHKEYKALGIEHSTQSANLRCEILSSYLSKTLMLIENCVSLEDLNKLVKGQPIYSQEGEDAILARFFHEIKDGFYVDVGAHHPTRFSNTYYFYKLGWRGINIEPDHEVKKLFDKQRPRDVTLDCAVADVESERLFYVFDEPALNTFSKPLADEYRKQGRILIAEKKIGTRTLSSILEEHVTDRVIDFMTIDVEDFELSVLESNDWVKFRPRLLLVEILNFDITQSEKYPVHTMLTGKGYRLWAKTFNTVFYMDATNNQ